MGTVIDLQAYRSARGQQPAVALVRAGRDMANGVSRMQAASALLAEAVAECRALAALDEAERLAELPAP